MLVSFIELVRSGTTGSLLNMHMSFEIKRRRNDHEW